VRVLKEELEGSIQTKAGAVLTRPAFQRFKKRLHHEEFGGAPLLGIKGMTIICHGSSSPKAIRNAIRVARDYCEGQMNERIGLELGVPVLLASQA
jgi:glycerol-3-phosphate acyltransferase PlsX